MRIFECLLSHLVNNISKEKKVKKNILITLMFQSVVELMLPEKTVEGACVRMVTFCDIPLSTSREHAVLLSTFGTSLLKLC